MADKDTTKWAEGEINRIKAEKDAEIDRIFQENERLRLRIRRLNPTVWAVMKVRRAFNDYFEELIKALAMSDEDDKMLGEEVGPHSAAPPDVLIVDDTVFEKVTRMKDAHVAMQQFESASALRGLLTLARQAIEMLEARGMTRAK